MHHRPNVNQHRVIEVFESSFKRVHLVDDTMTHDHVVQSAAKELHRLLEDSRDIGWVPHIELESLEELLIASAEDADVELVTDKQCDLGRILIA